MKKVIRIFSISFALMLTTMAVSAANFGHNGSVWLQGGQAWASCSTYKTTAYARTDVRDYGVSSYIAIPGWQTQSAYSTAVGQVRGREVRAQGGAMPYHYHYGLGSYYR